MQQTCWATAAEAQHLAHIDAAESDDRALRLLSDDAADEVLTEAGELLLHVAEDVRPRGQRGVRYSKAWNGLRLREGLTAEEIIEACIWAPGGADLRQAMHTLRERLRDQVRRLQPDAVDECARKLLDEQRVEALS